MKWHRIFIAFGLGLALALTIFWLFGDGLTAIQAQGLDASGIYYVSLDGDCGGMSPCFSSIQAAVDAVDDPNDVVKVATGIYTGVQTRASLNSGLFTATQTLAITKPLTLRGGYTISDWAISDLDANPTTLDAQGLGRVIVVIDALTVTLESLNITGGDASGLGGSSIWADNGGGMYIYSATVTISSCAILSNTASTVRIGEGGGLYLESSKATLEKNRFYHNIASTADSGNGGAIYTIWSIETIQDNTMQENIGSTSGTATFSDGGGLMLGPGEHVLRANHILSNTSALAGGNGRGGGLHCGGTQTILLEDNLVQGNIAGRDTWGTGGGFHFFATGADAIVRNNIFRNNIASVADGGSGGGAYLKGPMSGIEVEFNANFFISNTATLSSTGSGLAGGLGIYAGKSVTLTNNLIVGNHANEEGSGLWVGSSMWSPSSSITLKNNTIADNLGCGVGVHVDVSSTLVATNTVVVGHSHAGVWVAAESGISMEATLWHGNGSLTSGDGGIYTGTINVYGDPAFFDPSAWNYHLRAGSTAIDAGLETDVMTDMDGQVRPILDGYDIGADEALGGIYLPVVQKQAQFIVSRGLATPAATP